MCCPVVELRQYTLEPGRRDALIELFDREFVESQEAVGITVIGQFRDRRRDERFVWLRGFDGMESRRRALEAFYEGPVWAAHKNAANDTMLEWDDVRLLKPARPELTFRAAGTEAAAGPLDVIAGIHQLPVPATPVLVAEFEERVAPVLRAHAVRIEGVFVTEPARNSFPRLPVREGEHVLAWFGSRERGARSPAWWDRLAGLAALGTGPPSLLDLEPTSRSVLGRGPDALRSPPS